MLTCHSKKQNARRLNGQEEKERKGGRKEIGSTISVLVIGTECVKR